MTATLTRTSQALAEWSKVFPCQITETYTSSVTFIKQLTVVAVSTITYLKNAFPEDNYTVDQFGGLKVRVLKNKCEDELAHFLITSLTQAFDAFDKKYLQQIALCFYSCSRASGEGEANREGGASLLEYHVFEYSYGAAGASVRLRSHAPGSGSPPPPPAHAHADAAPPPAACSLDAIRERTLQLLRACMVMLSQSSLPEAYDVTLRLYYNEAAPEDYQAPGYRAAAGVDDLMNTADARLKLGAVRTPFHTLQLHTYARDIPPTSRQSSQKTPQASQNRECAGAGDTFSADDTPDAAGAPAGGVVGGASDVRCECARDDTPDYTAMLLCRVCGHRQHAACYGIRLRGGGSADVRQHCCVACSERSGAAADTGLAQASNRTCYAIFRRALWWLQAEGARAVSGAGLRAALRLPPASARKLLKVLRAHWLLAADPPASDTIEVEVTHEKLEAVMDRYFHRSEEDDITSRLVEESLSQSSDPLSAALSPMKRVSLHSGTVANDTQGAGAALYLHALGGEALPSLPPPAPPAPAPRKRRASARTGVRSKRVRAH